MVFVDSSVIELTDAQRRILAELITLHNTRSSGPVKGREIATAIDRNPGTIRTQMQSLKSLQLVKGIPGPRGGYEPTTRAYELADVTEDGEIPTVPISRDGEPLDDVSVTELALVNLQHPAAREAELSVQGSVQSLHEGDVLSIGPTPGDHLVVTGTVDGVDFSESVCAVSVDEMHFERSN